jgi:hypothetical protein
MSVDGSLWYVKLADGDVERFTLDQLDEAFQNGQIDENTTVLAAGSDQWLKLSDLLGLADATPPPPPPTPTPQAFTGAPAARQQAFHPPAPIATPPHAAIPAMQAKPMIRPPAGMPVMAGAVSVRPVTFDLGNQFDGGDVSYPKRSRKGLVVGFLGTAAVLGAAAFFVVTRTAQSASAADTTPVFAAAIAPAAPMPVTPTPPSTPQTSMPGLSPVMDPTQRLSDDQKQKLLEAEKKTKSHPKGHGGGGGGGGTATASRSKSSSATFTTTGSKYDPLNSSM